MRISTPFPITIYGRGVCACILQVQQVTCFVFGFEISLMIVSESPVGNTSDMVYVMAWCRTSDIALHELIMTHLIYIYVVHNWFQLFDLWSCIVYSRFGVGMSQPHTYNRHATGMYVQILSVAVAVLHILLYWSVAYPIIVRQSRRRLTKVI